MQFRNHENCTKSGAAAPLFQMIIQIPSNFRLSSGRELPHAPYFSGARQVPMAARTARRLSCVTPVWQRRHSSTQSFSGGQGKGG